MNWFNDLTSASGRRQIFGVVERRDFNVRNEDSSRRKKRKLLSSEKKISLHN